MVYGVVHTSGHGVDYIPWLPRGEWLYDGNIISWLWIELGLTGYNTRRKKKDIA